MSSNNLMDTIFGGIGAALGDVGSIGMLAAGDPKLSSGAESALSMVGGGTGDLGLIGDTVSQNPKAGLEGAAGGAAIAGTTAATIASLGTAAPAAGAADASIVGADTGAAATETSADIGAGAAADATSAAADTTDATATSGASSGLAIDPAATSSADAATAGASNNLAIDPAANSATATSTPASTTNPTLSNIQKAYKTGSTIENDIQKPIQAVQQKGNQVEQNNSTLTAPAPQSQIAPMQSAGIANNGTNNTNGTMFNAIFSPPSSIKTPQITGEGTGTQMPVPPMINPPPLVNSQPMVASDRNLKSNIKKADYSVKNFLKLITIPPSEGRIGQI